MGSFLMALSSRLAEAVGSCEEAIQFYDFKEENFS
jgi:hypothetical protein